MLKQPYLLVVFIFIHYTSFSQSIELRGTVSGESLKLVSASIQLKSFEQNLLMYGFTDGNGNYTINGQLDQSEKFLLISAYIGYKKDTLVIIRNDLLKQPIFHHNFTLIEDRKQLSEIYIKPPPAVAINNDTTKYNVLRFTSPEDRNLESVIRKMPGMEVNKDGTIFFKGKKISKVLLEGDDLTGEGYKAITKNLKPELVEEVQALEHYVEDNLLKGIINSDDIVLNLKVKNKEARKIIGSIDAGLGTIERRQISTNLISFIDKTKAFVFLNHSNLNGDMNSDILNLVDENRKFVGDNQVIKHGIGTYNPFDATRYTMNTTTQGSINAITRLSDKVKISYSMFYFHSKAIGQTSVQNTYFPPNLIYTEENDNRTSLDKILKGDFSVDYLVKKNARFWAKFVYKQEPKQFSSNAFSVFNEVTGDSVLQNQSDMNRIFNGQLKYTIKANQKTAYLLSARILADDVGQIYQAASPLYNNIPIFNGAQSLFQVVDNQNFKFRLDLEVLKRYDKNFLYLNIGNETNHFKIGSELLKINQGIGVVPGEDFINNNLFRINQTYADGKYVYNNHLVKVTAQLKTTLQFLKNMGKDSTYLLMEPSLSFLYKPNHIQNISLTYNYRNNNPQPIEYYTNYILTDIRSLNSGLNNFYNYNTHSAALSYSYNDFLNSYFILNIALNGTYNRYGFLYTNSFQNTFNYSKKEPYHGIKTVSANINTKTFIPMFSFTLSGSYSPSFSNYYSQSGSGVKKYTSLNHFFSTKINTGFNLPLNFGIGTEMQLNRTKNESIQIVASNAYKYSLEYRYRINERIFNFSSYNLYRMNGQNFNLIDTELQYNPVKGNFKYSIQGKNLMNLKAFTNLNISEVYSSNYSSSILGRYVMLNVSMSIK